jgi:hypothetical protein
MAVRILSLAFFLIALSRSDATTPGLFGKKTEPAPAPITLPWQEMSEKARKLAALVLEKPTLVSKGPSETFPCTPEQYYWLLENPERCVVAWRRMGAKCASISRRGDGVFAFTDELGSDVVWETLYRSKEVHVWYAEGKVRPGPVLPMVPVKALVVLRHAELKADDGIVTIQHVSEMALHTDSKVAASLTKMMGQSSHKVAEQGLGQLQLFFSGLSWYLDRHPNQREKLFRVDDATILPTGGVDR